MIAGYHDTLAENAFQSVVSSRAFRCRPGWPIADPVVGEVLRTELRHGVCAQADVVKVAFGQLGVSACTDAPSRGNAWGQRRSTRARRETVARTDGAGDNDRNVFRCPPHHRNDSDHHRCDGDRRGQHGHHVESPSWLAVDDIADAGHAPAGLPGSVSGRSPALRAASTLFGPLAGERPRATATVTVGLELWKATASR